MQKAPALPPTEIKKSSVESVQPVEDPVKKTSGDIKKTSPFKKSSSAPVTPIKRPTSALPRAGIFSPPKASKSFDKPATNVIWVPKEPQPKPEPQKKPRIRSAPPSFGGRKLLLKDERSGQNFTIEPPPKPDTEVRCFQLKSDSATLRDFKPSCNNPNLKDSKITNSGAVYHYVNTSNDLSYTTPQRKQFLPEKVQTEQPVTAPKANSPYTVRTCPQTKVNYYSRYSQSQSEGNLAHSEVFAKAAESRVDQPPGDQPSVEDYLAGGEESDFSLKVNNWTSSNGSSTPESSSFENQLIMSSSQVTTAPKRMYEKMVSSCCVFISSWERIVPTNCKCLATGIFSLRVSPHFLFATIILLGFHVLLLCLE